MRFISWLIGLPLAVLVVVFALSNRQDVVVGLWPFADGLPLPVYLLVLLPLLAGLLAGLGLGAVRNLGHRRRARHQTRRAEGFERELASLRASSSTPPASPAGDISVIP